MRFFPSFIDFFFDFYKIWQKTADLGNRKIEELGQSDE
jgi:hypothetical protein